MRHLPDSAYCFRLFGAGVLGAFLLLGQPESARRPSAPGEPVTADGSAVGSAARPARPVGQPCVDARAAGRGPGITPRDPDQLSAVQAAELERALRVALRARRPDDERARAPQTIRVPVYVHVIHSGSTGKLSRRTVERQISHLNAAHGGREGKGAAVSPFRFVLKGVTYTDNAAWFNQTQPGTSAEYAMKSKLRRGGPDTLNLYTVDTGSQLLGWSTYPHEYQNDPTRDGVVLAYDSLPGGGRQGYNQGDTGTHEIGHWLGLLHTFQSGCDEPGDYVPDTPPQAKPATGCPPWQDTCHEPGRDSVDNYMDYGSDTCMVRFTKGQVQRMVDSWRAFRS
ncbi:zinc metalloprotease [Carbonactinospora thermoautotrophica]|uniref:zinc metalloprotease n=1 Tax=Carbonactinospora thermoautotrophica TaxID=1469144 RepID=UPI000A6759FC|nr:zinc metalloprotease [Carbonactinospora thermoautotrophica]